MLFMLYFSFLSVFFHCYTVHSMFVLLCLKSFVKEREIQNIYICVSSQASPARITMCGFEGTTRAW